MQQSAVSQDFSLVLTTTEAHGWHKYIYINAQKEKNSMREKTKKNYKNIWLFSQMSVLFTPFWEPVSLTFLRNSASSFHWLSSSIFSCSSFVRPALYHLLLSRSNQKISKNKVIFFKYFDLSEIRGDDTMHCNAGRTNDEKLKIELLSQWKLEAEFRNSNVKD